MKNPFFILLFGILFSACTADDNPLERNPYLVDRSFSFQIDLNLPQYNQLNYPGNAFITYNYGINGIVIYNLNNSRYLAFELTDPNHPSTECSFLEVDGTEAVCNCQDGNIYTIITGQQISGEGEYSLKPYRAIRIGDVLEVSN